MRILQPGFALLTLNGILPVIHHIVRIVVFERIHIADRAQIVEVNIVCSESDFGIAVDTEADNRKSGAAAEICAVLHNAAFSVGRRRYGHNHLLPAGKGKRAHVQFKVVAEKVAHEQG